ncbi:hypothetical protein ACFPES_23935 [Paenibacillus sp. GCM10023248]|uniref:hypothetical protein n=1 Tax=Bacillales TaxID=1385 RepID=UPI002379A59E|nr:MULTISPECIES: hypothetical protein [Bacillales]MDD9270110.1 hypothetical protein [Paenibacillus sp. MAHUQ-63]MDR6880246.1 uncharacterized protein YidB (DUF937 family) [Bacillus sp. 3255]
MKQSSMKKFLVTTTALSFILGASVLPSLSVSAQEPSLDPEEIVSVQQGDEKAGGHHGRKWPIIEESATVIGVEKDVLVKSLKSGKSIVEAAADKGVSEADLTAKLQQLRTGKIDAAVKDGKLTADQGEHMKQKLGEHLKFILNEKNLLDGHAKGKGHRFGLKPDTDKLAQTLGLSKDELHAQLRSGKSLAEIAQAKGISKDKLVASIKDQLTPSIEKWVDHKKDAKAK